MLDRGRDGFFHGFSLRALDFASRAATRAHAA
jgi:hypothetical protein